MSGIICLQTFYTHKHARIDLNRLHFILRNSNKMLVSTFLPPTKRSTTWRRWAEQIFRTIYVFVYIPKKDIWNFTKINSWQLSSFFRKHFRNGICTLYERVWRVCGLMYNSAEIIFYRFICVFFFSQKYYILQGRNL